jgi:hypothetical protein
MKRYKLLIEIMVNANSQEEAIVNAFGNRSVRKYQRKQRLIEVREELDTYQGPG